MTDDTGLDLETLQEELAEARAELERLASLAADREARARHLDEVATGLRRELAAAQESAQAGRMEAQTLQQRLEEAEGRLASATSRYRELALRAEPELPADLVSGDSVEELDESISRAREMVTRVREQIETQSRAGRIPTGAPPRTGTQPADLSPREKIARGLERHER